MEHQIADYLDKTVASNESTRKQAELDLSHLHRAPHFGLHLLSVACSDGVAIHIRMAALLYMRKFVEWGWSSEFEQFRGTVLVSDEDKVQLRQILLDVALNCPERKLRKQASWVVSKIGSSDFPDEWPQLLPTALSVVQGGNEDQIPGALKLLVDLIDDSFNEEQFFGVARDMVNTVYNVAINEAVKPTTRALAITVFRGCIDILEILLEEYKAQVKAFADEALQEWIPFMIKVMETTLPNPPSAEEEDSKSPVAEKFRTLVALKIQAVKVRSASTKILTDKIDFDASENGLPIEFNPVQPSSVFCHMG
jgi:importin-9